MSEQEAAVAEQEVSPAPAPEAGLSSQEQPKAPDRDYEAEALVMGWVPKEQYKGDADKWKPAQQFVEDGERILPIVRSQLKRTREELAAKEAEFQKRLERMERMASENMKRAKEQHTQELERIKREQRAAAEVGDTEKYDALDKQREQLAQTKFEDVEEVKGKQAPSAGYDEAVNAFRSANKWYGTDDDLTTFAEGYSQALAKRNPSITLEENLRLTAERVKVVFPQKFQSAPKESGHAAVDGGGAFAGARPQKGPADKLPAEAKRQAEADVKAGLYKNVDDWARVYFG
jgi:hypothetical protein